MAETEGQPASGDEVRPQETPNTEVQPPRNDAEAAQQEQAKAEAEAQKKPEPKPEEKPKRNRTGEYIHRLQTRVNELTAALEAQKNPAKAPDAPTFEQSNFDAAAYAEARAQWAAQTAVDAYKQQQQKEHVQRQMQEITEGYNAKLGEFAAAHPDFAEKVQAIPYQPSDAVQFAIMAHEKGPEIAYAIANDDDLAFQLASIQPHLAAAAVDRIASRLAAAQSAPQATPQPAATQASAKPVSSAPPPVQTVSGKTPSATPPEKLTDDQWWARRQKRAS